MNMHNPDSFFPAELIVSPLKSVAASEQVRKEAERRARNAERIRQQNAARAKKR